VEEKARGKPGRCPGSASFKKMGVTGIKCNKKKKKHSRFGHNLHTPKDWTRTMGKTNGGPVSLKHEVIAVWKNTMVFGRTMVNPY